MRLAFGFDDETFVATAGVDVDATSTAPRDGNGLAAGFEVVWRAAFTWSSDPVDAGGRRRCWWFSGPLAVAGEPVPARAAPDQRPVLEQVADHVGADRGVLVRRARVTYRLDHLGRGEVDPI